MSIRLLYIFKIVCECESITMAAQKLYMSQPAVTHAIQELEQKVAICLFERIGKRLYISDSGRQFYQKVCALLTMYEELEQSAKALEEYPPLRIGSSITNAYLLLPKLLASFQKMYPKQVQVMVDNAAHIEEKLTKNEIDLAFIEGAIASSTFLRIPIFSYDLQVFCSPCHPLANAKDITLQALSKEPWLLREKGSAIRNTLDSACLLHDRIIEPLWESVNSQVLIQAVKQGLGISVLPRVLLQEALASEQISEIHLVEPLSCVNHIVYHKDKHIHNAMRHFLTLCEQECIEISGISS